MRKRHRERILPFKVVATNEPLIARGGLVLPYELARALKLPKVIDEDLPPPGNVKGYKPSKFVIPLVLIAAWWREETGRFKGTEERSKFKGANGDKGTSCLMHYG